MDDDEKEMIAEARVRLANIKGKKAKRIAREKVLDEARRLAQLQKFRELKSAGIDFVIERKRRKKKHEFNYENEVPLERQPLEMVFNTKAERKIQKGDLNLGNITINQLEGKRRDEEEMKKRKEDIRKLKKLREMDLPSRIKRVNALNPMNFVKKRDLELEKPQLADEDIQELVKLSKRSSRMEESISGLSKRVKRPSDFLLQNNCMEEIQTIVGQTVTPKTGGNLLAKAREILEVADPEYASRMDKERSQAGSEIEKEVASVNSYFTGGLSLKENFKIGQMNLENLDNGSSSKTLNPYKELVRSIRSENQTVNQNPSKMSQKDESLYSMKSISVMSKMNDHLSINSPWLNSKRVSGEGFGAESQSYRSQWGDISQKKKKRKLIKLVNKELADLPEPENDFEINYTDLVENLQMVKEAELGEEFTGKNLDQRFINNQKIQIQQKMASFE